jgi:hypothetical protein
MTANVITGGVAMRWVSTALLLTLSVAGVAAPVPKKPDYFPTVTGAKWEYAAEGEKEVVFTSEVTKVTVKDGVRTVEISSAYKADDTAGSVAVYRVDADGVALTASEGHTLTPARLDLRAVPKAEDKWDSPHEWRSTKYALAVAVGEEEKLKLPAGTFTALPHVQTFTFDDVKAPARTTWYAPGVGPVKMATADGTALVLVKYTAGKDK